MRLAALCIAALCLGLFGCDEDKVTTGGKGKVNRKTATEEKVEVPTLPAPVDFQEAEFVESDRSRDPFRSFAKTFLLDGKDRIKSQREVVLGQYSVDELRLVGIVTRINPPRAMLVDPTGVGHVVSRGQFVGRPAIVQPASGSGAAYEVHWRIDRIREGDIVLVREDQANPDVPSATRVIALRTDKDTLVAAEEGAPAASPEALDRQVEELKKRLESVEQRRTTVEVREVPSAPPSPVAASPADPTIVKAPRAN